MSYRERLSGFSHDAQAAASIVPTRPLIFIPSQLASLPRHLIEINLASPLLRAMMKGASQLDADLLLLILPCLYKCSSSIALILVYEGNFVFLLYLQINHSQGAVYLSFF